MISKRLRGSLDSSICIRDIFEEGKKMAAIYGSENIFNFTIGNPSVEPPAAVNEALPRPQKQPQTESFLTSLHI